MKTNRIRKSDILNKKVFLVAGGRPNFMKIAPIYEVTLPRKTDPPLKLVL